MPAVELLKLRAQIRKLTGLYAAPEAFYRGLKDLLDQYANRAYRAGAAVKPQPLLPSYRVTPLIMRELELELTRLSQELPFETLQIVEYLWQDSYLETRQIAGVLLGAVPIEHGNSVIEKIRAWSQAEENFRVLDSLFQSGTTSLRRNGSMLPLQLAEEWISGSRPRFQALGLRLLIPLVREERFENLPPIYRMVAPLVQNISATIFADLQAVLEALIERSPAETAFFLRQALPIAANPTTARLVRRCLPLFDPEQQANLKSALRATNIT